MDCLRAYEDLKKCYYEFSLNHLVASYVMVIKFPKASKPQLVYAWEIHSKELPKRDVLNQFKIISNGSSTKAKFESHFAPISTTYRIGFSCLSDA